MKKLLLSLMFFSVNVFACTGYVIGFMGKDNVFDHRAFVEYAESSQYCHRVYPWYATLSAQKFISTLTIPYELYGYSQGAASIGIILNSQISTKPKFIITIGAYRTADVNFDKFKILYVNYFDHSGKGQTSPGIFLDVPHNKIQQEVNKILFGKR